MLVNLRPSWYFTHMENITKLRIMRGTYGFWIRGSLLCHFCCDTGPWLLQSDPKLFQFGCILRHTLCFFSKQCRFYFDNNMFFVMTLCEYKIATVTFLKPNGVTNTTYSILFLIFTSKIMYWICVKFTESFLLSISP